MNALEQHLRASSPVPFREFMRAALFDPEHGYYSKHVRTVGRGGDFSTAPTLSPRFGRGIGRWLRRAWEDRRRRTKNVIEVGAGDGSLARSVIDTLGLLGRRRVRYHIVETSPTLAAVQQDQLRKSGNFRWHGSMREALAAVDGEAMIISNELVDAFPATLIEWDAGRQGWFEVELHAEGDSWSARPGSYYEPPPGSPLAEGHTLPDGQRIERHDSYFEWLADWLPLWRGGEMLTIDYGDLFPAVYHRRPRGTLRAYFAQQRLESLPEILTRPGRQDITADIDFSELRWRGRRLGLREIGYSTQADFVESHAPAKGDLSQADRTIADPDGAGGAFKVLIQRPPAGH